MTGPGEWAVAMTAANAMFLTFAAIALALGVVSAIRLVQRAAAKRWVSVTAFAVRLALSGVLLWLIVRVLAAEP